MHLSLPGLQCAHVWISRVHLWIAVCTRVNLSCAFVDCVHECGSLACICGLCERVWISPVHLWIVSASVHLSRAFVDCVHECGSLACICGLCPRVWISRVHLWIVWASVDLSRAFVDCVHEYGSLPCICGLCAPLACICGLCAWVWISRVHLWIVWASVDLSCAFVDRPVDLSRAFVDCVHECGSLACICGRIWYCFHSIDVSLKRQLWCNVSFPPLRDPCLRWVTRDVFLRCNVCFVGYISVKENNVIISFVEENSATCILHREKSNCEYTEFILIGAFIY